MSRPFKAVRLGSALLLPLAALTACSGAANPTGPASSGASSAAADPTAGLPTGTKLKAMLLPGSAMPAGYKPQQDATRDTGDTFQPPSTSPAETNCTKLETTGWIDNAHIGPASFAQSDFMDAYSQEINQEIDAFPGDTAKTVLDRIGTLAKSCSSFKDKAGSTPVTYKVTVKPVAGLGDEGIEAVLSSADLNGGIAVIAARSGNKVFTAWVNTASAKSATMAVGYAEKLAANIKAAG